MVGVVVGLQDVLDADAEVAGEPQVLVDVELGVHDGGDAGVLVADEVAGATEVVVSELAEDHRVLPSVSSPWRSHAVIPPETLWASRPARRAAVAAIAERRPLWQMKATGWSVGSSPSRCLSWPSGRCREPGAKPRARSASSRTSTRIRRPASWPARASTTSIVRERLKPLKIIVITRVRSGRRAGRGAAARAATTPTCPAAAVRPGRAAGGRARRRAGRRCRG